MKKILLFFICLLLLLNYSSVITEVNAHSNDEYISNASTNSMLVVNNHKELLREIGIAVSFFEPTLKIKSTFEPDRLELSFPNIAEQSRKINTFTGSLLNSFKYKYKPCQGGYEITFDFHYYISQNQYYEIKNIADEFANNMIGWSDYEKVKYTHDYLIETCTYDINKDGPYNCLINKRCNCNGYALAFCLIMQSCDIECHYITGTDHAWNAVKLGSFWYNIDVTWDDTGSGISYDYFLCGKSEWKKHRTTEATAGFSYNESEIVNWIGTIFYWGWLPATIAIISTIVYIIQKRRGSIYD